MDLADWCAGSCDGFARVSRGGGHVPCQSTKRSIHRGIRLSRICRTVAARRPRIPAMEPVHVWRDAVRRRHARRHLLSDVFAAPDHADRPGDDLGIHHALVSGRCVHRRLFARTWPVTLGRSLWWTVVHDVRPNCVVRVCRSRRQAICQRAVALSVVDAGARNPRRTAVRVGCVCAHGRPRRA